jgi:multiple sugar transport system permease protein
VVGLSLTRHVMGQARGFGGIDNFHALAVDPLFWRVMGNTALWVFGATAGAAILGLAIGQALAADSTVARVVRAVILIPWVLPDVVAAMAWRWMLHGQVGVVNDVLVRLGVLAEGIPWLGRPDLVMPTLVGVMIWRKVPLAALVLCAAIRSVPVDLHEAARLDGAGAWARFRYVTLPHIAFSLTAIVVILLIWTTADFTIVWVMTRGGPANASHIISTYIYQLAFEFFNWGPAAALAVINLAFLGLLVAVYLTLVRRSWGRGA